MTDNFAKALEQVELDLVGKLSKLNHSLNDDVKEEIKERCHQVECMKSYHRSQQRRDGLKKVVGIVEKLQKGETEYEEKHGIFEVHNRFRSC